ncbi:glycosyltransferase [Cellulosimicrobium funkei]|uniref:glycosyltransferase n=1 Tax=Cellulosimicrobium funkei TaxID=264251 RepID=UPI000B2EBB9A|nr:glycosyltransferase [Cellulosimicrobium funkei]
MSISGTRILVIGANYAPEPTGNAPYTSALSRALVARGARVRVVTTYPHYPQWRVRVGDRGWARRERIDGVDVLRLRHYVPRSPTSARRLLAELSFGVRSAAVRWPDADVVLLVSPSLFAAAVAMLRLRAGRALAPRRARRTALPGAVLWTQDLYSLGVAETGTASGLAARAVSAVERFTARGADGVVAIHESFARHLRESLGVDAAALRVVRNWTHLADDVEPAERPAVRAAHGWAQDETVVLHAGNQGVKQGLENVVEAARRADAQGAAVRFVLLGDGSRRAALEAAGAGVRSLQFLDPLPDTQFRAALRAADVLLVNELAGLAEMSVPSKLTSYFHAARPVLAASSERSTTAVELRASGGGVRVDPEDPQALLDAALVLAADPARRDRLGAAGRRYRDERLTEGAAVDAFAAVLAATARRPVPEPRTSAVATDATATAALATATTTATAGTGARGTARAADGAPRAPDVART